MIFSRPVFGTFLLPTLLVVSFLTGGAAARAQIVSDRSGTACDGATQHLYEILDGGMPVVIANLAWDCSICRGDAPHVNTFSDTYGDRIRFWAPMFRLEHAAKIPMTCENMRGWREQFGWENVFTFLDEPVTWAYEFGTHYLIIDPRDRSVYWKGNNVVTMQEKALELVAATDVGSEEFGTVAEGASIIEGGAALRLVVDGGEGGSGALVLYDLLGRPVFGSGLTLAPGENRLIVPLERPLDRSLYVMTLQTSKTARNLIVRFE